MSLFGMLQTNVSGMIAQTNRLGTIADNIANSSTTGYKSASVEFSSLVLSSKVSTYQSGAVSTAVRHSISQQGELVSTSSSTDLAISGNGFFVVSDPDGGSYLTRAGAFSTDQSGYLVNSLGYQLMGYAAGGGTSLTAINLSASNIAAVQTTTAKFAANLNSSSDEITSDLPSDNLASSTYTHKSAISAFDSSGNEVVYDLYFSKTADSEWEVSIYVNSEAASGTGFPYGGLGLAGSALLRFNSDGTLDTSGDTSATIYDSVNNMDIQIDFTGMTQLATGFTATNASVNGSAAGTLKSASIESDGSVYANYSNGASKLICNVALASVASPDLLDVVGSDLYLANENSGAAYYGYAESGGFGTINASTLEMSNVDLSNELTNMIESQKSFTMNSKAFQVTAELLKEVADLRG